MRQSDDITNLVSSIIALIQSDNTINQPAKDTICNVTMIIGLFLKDIHRIADGIEKISEEI